MYVTPILQSAQKDDLLTILKSTESTTVESEEKLCHTYV